MYVKLAPISSRGERLAPHTETRPCLEWNYTSPSSSNSNNDNNMSVTTSGTQIIGRNDFTKISDPVVSRQLASLNVNTETKTVSLTLLKAPTEHYLSIQGEHVKVHKGHTIPLHQGDRICLYNSMYEYVCHIQEEGPPCQEESQDSMTQQQQQQQKSMSAPTISSQSSCATVAPLAVSSTTTATACAANISNVTPEHKNKDGIDILKTTELTEEATCSICMDIMVDTTSIVPCGHMFCKSCLEGITQCPNCRHTKTTTIPSKSFDNMIWHMVRSKHIFPQEDVLHYLERTQNTLSKEESLQILGKVLPPSSGSKRSATSKSSPVRKRRRTTASITTGQLWVAAQMQMRGETSLFSTRSQQHHQQQHQQQQQQGTSRDDAICID